MNVIVTLNVQTRDFSGFYAADVEDALRTILADAPLIWYDASLGRHIYASASVESVEESP